MVGPWGLLKSRETGGADAWFQREYCNDTGWQNGEETLAFIVQFIEHRRWDAMTKLFKMCGKITFGVLYIGLDCLPLEQNH